MNDEIWFAAHASSCLFSERIVDRFERAVEIKPNFASTNHDNNMSTGINRDPFIWDNCCFYHQSWNKFLTHMADICIIFICSTAETEKREGGWVVFRLHTSLLLLRETVYQSHYLMDEAALLALLNEKKLLLQQWKSPLPKYQCSKWW